MAWTTFITHLDCEGRVLHMLQSKHSEVGDFQACRETHQIIQGTAWRYIIIIKVKTYIHIKHWKLMLNISKLKKKKKKKKTLLYSKSVRLQENTSWKSLSVCIIMSQDWQGLSLKLSPFTVALIPPSVADTTSEHTDDALSRRMCSMCGRNGPPKTNCKFKPIYSINFSSQIKMRENIVLISRVL